jgi:hypothetical protein
MTAPEDHSRLLGVIECFSAVVRQCPNGSARRLAENALAAIEREGAAALPEQAFLVLTAARGWQGERAAQVRRSLERFLEETGPGSP